MTRPVADLVKHVWTGTGDGTITLGAAVTGFNTFPAAADGLTVSYAIEHEDGTQRETGRGTYTHSGTTLSRDTVTFSTAGGTTKEDFAAGNKFVRLVALGTDVAGELAALDAVGTARISSGALGPIPDDAGFDPTAIDLSGNSAPDHTQDGATQLALNGGVTPIGGAVCWIAWTGDGSDITCDDSTVKWSDGTAGAKTLGGLGTLMVMQHPALGYAVAYLGGEAFATAAQGTKADNAALARSTIVAASLGSGAVTCDLSAGAKFSVTINGSWNAGAPLVGSNPPSSGVSQTIELVATISGSQTVDLDGLPWLGDIPFLNTEDGDAISLSATWEGSSLVEVTAANRA